MVFNRKVYSKQYYKDNKEQILEQQKKYKRQWRKDHKEKIRIQTKQYYLKYRKQMLEQQGKYRKNQYKINLKVNLRDKIRTAIWKSLKGNKAGRYWEDLVGYTLEELKNHLKKTLSKGYTWQDYLNGKLHIDHIIPIRAFVFDKPEDPEFKDCWNLCNLRLLTASKNSIKRSNFDNPILLGLLLNGHKWFL